MIENPNVICNNCGFCKQNKELEDKCEHLEKQLKIAVEALKYIYDDTKNGHTQCDACGYCSSCETCINVDWAEKALQQIKELENKNKIFTYMGKPVDALTYIEKKIEYERKKIEYERKELEK